MRFVSFAGNCGQSAAFAAGFRFAAGDVLVTLDADLIRWLLFLLYGSRVLPDRVGYIAGLTGLFQRFAVAEEVDRGAARAVGKEHGDGLRPFGDILVNKYG